MLKYKNKNIEKHIRSNKINNYYKNKYKNECIKKHIGNRRIKERKIDIIHKIYHNLENRIYTIFVKYNLEFNISYKKLIGCNTEELKKFISNKFKDGMTFTNYGDWEIDHIKPVSKFNFNNRNELFECFNYINLQPLWQSENRKKFNHY